MISPVVLTPQEQQWQATWSDKNTSLGRINSSTGGGGKVEADAPEPKRKQPRTDETIEPVFFHSLPTSVFTELLVAFHIVGVIDLCAGEGTCAMAC